MRIFFSANRITQLICFTLLISCGSTPNPLNPKCCNNAPEKIVTITKEKFNFSKKEMLKSMVLIRGALYDGDIKIDGYTGSGSVVAHDDISTLILTAAHVCLYNPHLIKSVMEKSKNPSLVNLKLSVMDREEKIHGAMAYAAAVDFDACIIQIPKINVKSVLISENPPSVGDAVFNISAPHGHFAKEVAPMFEGYYSGTTKIRKTIISLYAIAGAPGSSGSPLLNSNGKIIGVVSSVKRSFHHLMASPTYEQLKMLQGGRALVITKQFLSFKEYAEIVGKILGNTAKEKTTPP